MTTRRKPKDPTPPDAGQEPKPDPLDELLGIFDEASDRAQLQKRVDGAYGWVAEIDLASDVTTAGDLMRLVRERWGTGTYKLVVKDDRAQYKGQRVFRVFSADGVAPDTEAAAPPEGDRLARLERVVERLSTQAAPSGGFDGRALADMMSAAMSSQATMLAPLLAAMSKSKGPSATEILDLVRAGMELKGEASTPPDPYGPMMANILASFQNGGQPAAQPNPPTTPPAMPPTHPDHVRALAPHLPSLELAAAGGVDPEQVAQLVARGAAPELIDAIEEHADDLPDQLAAAYPGLAPHRAYIAAVVDVLFPPDDGPDDSGGPGAPGGAPSQDPAGSRQPATPATPATASAGGGDVRDA